MTHCSSTAKVALRAENGHGAGKVYPLKQVEKWLISRPGPFFWEMQENGIALIETASHKQRTLRRGEVERVEHRTNAITNESYVVMLLETGHQLVLASQGFVFAPDFTNTGPIDTPSPVYCFADFEHLMRELQALATMGDRRKDALDLVMLCISILDGARAVGLEVSREEERVETLLAQLENAAAV